MWTEHTEYEEYQKLQRSTVVIYQHNNTGQNEDPHTSHVPKHRSVLSMLSGVQRTERWLTKWMNIFPCGR